MTRLWMVRAGKHGEYEQRALDEGKVIIQWEVGDLGPVQDWKAVRERVSRSFPDESKHRIGSWAGQLYAFRCSMRLG